MLIQIDRLVEQKHTIDDSGGFHYRSAVFRKPYIYQLVDPATRLPFYIGKGHGQRVFSHESEARNGLKSDKCELIRAIWKRGETVHREILMYFDSEKLALKYEARLIKKLQVMGVPLLRCR